MKWFLETRLIILWLLIIAFELTSQSEILIIRHGRSRSRHSVEKDHVRWGLQALDNLTIVASHDEFLESAENNETNGELSVVSFYENNGTLSGEFNGSIGSYEINYTPNPSKSKAANERSVNKKQYFWHHQKQIPPPTQAPKSTTSTSVSALGKRRSGRKKEIMTNIKNTVNKGIQYLKSHENLDEIKIEINDVNAKDGAEKSNKIRSQSSAKTDQALIFHRIRSPKQIKINGGKELGIVTIDGLLQNEKNKNANPTPKMKKSNDKIPSQRHAAANAAKHIKNHLARNEMDLKINTNLADVFYIPTSTEDAPPGSDDEQMQGDQPPSGEMPTKLPRSGSHRLVTAAPIDYTTVASVNANNLAAEMKGGSPAIDKLKSKSDVFNGNGMSRSGFKAQSGTYDDELTTSSQARIDIDEVELFVGSQQSDDGISDDEMNEDFINAIGIQNDESSSHESADDFEQGVEQNTNVNGIFNVDDHDLRDFDETSRNNRKNLMHGKDIVTRFLQIVESQHILGGNCTAGTALHLGEGVVDRYAQERFRVEAEVAVNRANMLTR